MRIDSAEFYRVFEQTCEFHDSFLLKSERNGNFLTLSFSEFYFGLNRKYNDCETEGGTMLISLQAGELDEHYFDELYQTKVLLFEINLQKRYIRIYALDKFFLFHFLPSASTFTWKVGAPSAKF